MKGCVAVLHRADASGASKKSVGIDGGDGTLEHDDDMHPIPRRPCRGYGLSEGGCIAVSPYCDFACTVNGEEKEPAAGFVGVVLVAEDLSGLQGRGCGRVLHPEGYREGVPELAGFGAEVGVRSAVPRQFQLLPKAPAVKVTWGESAVAVAAFGPSDGPVGLVEGPVPDEEESTCGKRLVEPSIRSTDGSEEE